MEYTVENCETEPIHLIGYIQEHGALLAINHNLDIVCLSQNADSYFDIEPHTLLNQPLHRLVGDSTHAAVAKRLESPGRKIPYMTDVVLPHNQHRFDVTVHSTASDLTLLEFEPTSDEASMPYRDLYATSHMAITQLHNASDVIALCRAAAAEVRQLTGHDRVMVYRFGPEGNGEVIAEARAPHIDSFLGLHYPASDIPTMARQLFLSNRVRMIPDVDYEPVPLITMDTSPQLDLSPAMLRGVSPGHIVYLKNMGVRASLTIAIVRDNQLWGLFACHHQTPLHIPYELRVICEFLGTVFSAQITTLEDQDIRRRQKSMERQIRHFLDQEIESELPTHLRQHSQTLLSIFEADGLAIWHGDKVLTIGKTPSESQLEHLVEWLDQQTPVFHTNHLAKHLIEAEAYAETACGLLSLSLSTETRFYVLWFRSEMVQHVTWGTAPEKQLARREDDTLLFTPQDSFRQWQELVRYQARPWDSAILAMADELRTELLDIRLKLAVSSDIEQMRTVIEAMPTIVFIRRDDQLLYVNPVVERITGYAPYELLAGKSTSVLNGQKEHRIITANGEERWLYISTEPIVFENQQAVLGSAVDITNRINSQTEADRRMLEQQRIRILADFVRNASTDLRTPLAVIFTNMFMLKQSRDPNTQRDLLESVERQASHLHVIVNGLLKMAQLDLETPLSLTPVSIKNVLSQVTQNLQPLLTQKLHLLTLNVPADVPSVAGDREELTICFEQLLRNAIIFTPPSGAIHIAVSQDENDNVITINDNGMGIAAKDLPHVFDRFYRGENATQYPGSGLGLAIAAKILEMHEGQIDIESNAGVGTTVRVHLPIWSEP